MSNPAKEFFVPQNSEFPRCVDGRMAIAIIAWLNGLWRVEKKGAEAAKENGPQFLGASLLFVKVLQEIATKSLDEAFDLVEEASRNLGWGLQIHIDDHHGKHDFANMTDEEIVEIATRYDEGCGFAKFAWGDQGSEVVAKAKSRHWRIQVLVDEHKETRATMNNVVGQTFNTADAVKSNSAAFNTDAATAEEIFIELGRLIGDDKFAEKASEWNSKTFGVVVKTLKGIKTVVEVN